MPVVITESGHRESEMVEHARDGTVGGSQLATCESTRRSEVGTGNRSFPPQAVQIRQSNTRENIALHCVRFMKRLLLDCVPSSRMDTQDTMGQWEKSRGVSISGWQTLHADVFGRILSTTNSLTLSH